MKCYDRWSDIPRHIFHTWWNRVFSPRCMSLYFSIELAESQTCLRVPWLKNSNWQYTVFNGYFWRVLRTVNPNVAHQLTAIIYKALICMLALLCSFVVEWIEGACWWIRSMHTYACHINGFFQAETNSADPDCGKHFIFMGLNPFDLALYKSSLDAPLLDCLAIIIAVVLSVSFAA